MRTLRSMFGILKRSNWLGGSLTLVNAEPLRAMQNYRLFIRGRGLVWAVALGVLFCSDSSASNLLINGSFENVNGGFVANANGFEEVAVGSAAIEGWTVFNDSVSWLSNSNAFGLTASDGSFFLDLTGDHDDGVFGGVAQMIDTTVGATYDFSFDLLCDQSRSVWACPVSVTASANSTSENFTFSSAAPGNQFQDFSMSFTATSDTTLFSIIGDPSNHLLNYLGLDNASVIETSPPPTPTPEPANFGSLLLGVGVLIASRKR